GELQTASAVMVAFVFMPRPAEVMRIRVLDVVPPPREGGAGRSRLSLVLHPLEQGVSSKTGEYDEWLVLDNPEFAWLGSVLGLLRQEAKGEYLFGFSYADWVQSFADVGRRLRLGSLGSPVLCQHRHGGASHEALTGFRDAAGLKQRGRWSSDASVRRCAKGGRVNQALASLSAAMRSGVALEIFSGSGRLSHSWRRHHRLASVPIYEIDIHRHQTHDLTVRKSQRIIRGLIQHGLVRAVWLGVPCNTFSRARESGPPGPPPLRSAEFPTGPPNLKPHDQQKLEVGNALAAFAARVMNERRRRNAPVVFESPWTSRLFQQPCFLRLPKGVLRTVVADYCQVGTRWRKRTQLWGYNIDLSRVGRLCSGRGICSRTKQSRVTSRGKQAGTFVTAAAEPYPRPLCNRLAQAFADALVAGALCEAVALLGRVAAGESAGGACPRRRELRRLLALTEQAGSAGPWLAVLGTLRAMAGAGSEPAGCPWPPPPPPHVSLPAGGTSWELPFAGAQAAQEIRKLVFSGGATLAAWIRLPAGGQRGGMGHGGVLWRCWEPAIGGWEVRLRWDGPRRGDDGGEPCVWCVRLRADAAHGEEEEEEEAGGLAAEPTEEGEPVFLGRVGVGRWFALTLEVATVEEPGAVRLGGSAGRWAKVNLGPGPGRSRFPPPASPARAAARARPGDSDAATAACCSWTGWRWTWRPFSYSGA
ncbi:unnamed protein product, partial [Prorocentrum cordatum]